MRQLPRQNCHNGHLCPVSGLWPMISDFDSSALTVIINGVSCLISVELMIASRDNQWSNSK